MSQDDVFEKIEQIVFDENKIITYKGLSRIFNIHPNKAKQFLYQFLNTYRSKGHDRLSAHYFVAGLQSKGDSQFVKLIVVSADELEDAKKDFVSLTSLHIYCLQNGQLEDKCALYTTDYGQTKSVEDQNRHTAIEYSEVRIQPGRVIKYEAASSLKEKPKTNSTEVKCVPKIEEKAASKGKKPALFSMWQKISNEKKPVEEAKNTNRKTDETQIADSNKAKSATTDAKKTTQESSLKTKGKGDRNDVKSLFSKQAEKNLLNLDVKKVNEKMSQNVIANVKNSKTEEKVTKEPVKMQSKQRVKLKKSKKMSDSDSDEYLKPKRKKHKRIVMMVDSDSESECEEQEDKSQRILFDSESPLPEKIELEEDDEEPIPPTPPVRCGKNKILKVVTKTFEDEEGFFVTKKVKEYVTASDESEGEDPLKPKAKTTSKKESVPKNLSVNRKQASLTSFFKQK